ncbi:hypothetical protein [Actinomadura fibrosa]|uniref:DUF2238 domain-containing protein n=1 Tax=Actinomadura fibrosa TaxID=111802 RepID=A0ABW2XYU3_9ACTN|nr:hypothetical protein [Actinomadura fibrosa]
MDTTRWRLPALLLKAVLAALLVLALAFPDWDRFADKAMGARAIGYPLAVLLLPVLWTAFRRRGVPWDIDLLITAPFVIDVAGNALDLYDTVDRFDDACHFGNWFLLAAAAGVAVRRWGRLPSWAVALSCAGIGAITAILWELAEYQLFILDTPETVTIYRDTIGDLMLGLLGSAAAGALTAVATRRGGRTRPVRPDVLVAGAGAAGAGAARAEPVGAGQ